MTGEAATCYGCLRRGWILNEARSVQNTFFLTKTRRVKAPLSWTIRNFNSEKVDHPSFEGYKFQENKRLSLSFTRPFRRLAVSFPSFSLLRRSPLAAPWKKRLSPLKRTGLEHREEDYKRQAPYLINHSSQQVVGANCSKSLIKSVVVMVSRSLFMSTLYRVTSVIQSYTRLSGSWEWVFDCISW